MTAPPANEATVASLFSGIGGIDLGLQRAGIHTQSLCDSWEPAQRVLADQWPDAPISDDVQAIDQFPVTTTAITAGFPCTNLSLAGTGETRGGISGPASGLVREALRLAASPSIRWVLLENVPTLLRYNGAAMTMIVEALEAAQYRWAYRTVDARFAGVPQRRARVLIYASRDHAPQDVLLSRDAGPPDPSRFDDRAFGFYWTEGRRGLGWTWDAIPPLKGGSTIGIASPPAVWLPGAEHGHRIVLPTTAQGEALQGFPAGWTDAAGAGSKPDHRWKLIGNAVPVPIAEWFGRVVTDPVEYTPEQARPFPRDRSWPAAGWGGGGESFRADVSPWPEHRPYEHLAGLMGDDGVPLSFRATRGFLRRIEESGLCPDPAFIADLHLHLASAPGPRPAAPPRRPRRRATIDATRSTPVDAETGQPTGAASWATDASTRRRMQANRGKDTSLEVALRRELFRRGLRFRLQGKIVPGTRRTVDIYFSAARLAVDVRGCYWHACPDHGTWAKNHADYWMDKLHRNVERDVDTQRRLVQAGWRVAVVWEHDDEVEAADRIETLVRTRKGNASTA